MPYSKVQFDYPTESEVLEGLQARREFIKKNNPAVILKRQAEIDEVKE